jgi:hypothetical protein
MALETGCELDSANRSFDGVFHRRKRPPNVRPSAEISLRRAQAWPKSYRIDGFRDAQRRRQSRLPKPAASPFLNRSFVDQCHRVDDLLTQAARFSIALIATRRATDWPRGIRTHWRSPTFTAYSFFGVSHALTRRRRTAAKPMIPIAASESVAGSGTG